MKTAIILTAIVIAVIIYSLCKVSGECAKIEESAEWARKWNEQREKENKEAEKQWCDGGCKGCAADKCFFREV